VADAAVVGVPSAEWGETAGGLRRAPRRPRRCADAIKRWLNERVGKTQRWPT
jgi:hypothetical protein